MVSAVSGGTTKETAALLVTTQAKSSVNTLDGGPFSDDDITQLAMNLIAAGDGVTWPDDCGLSTHSKLRAS